MRSKDESKITIIGENMDTLIGETLNMAVIETNIEAVRREVRALSNLGMIECLSQSNVLPY